MQTLKFIRRSHGVSKAKNEPYDMTEVSDGLSSFTLSNAEGVGERLREMELNEGDEFEAEVHVRPVFGQLRGTIVDVQ
jgi:hypothetical protein